MSSRARGAGEAAPFPAAVKAGLDQGLRQARRQSRASMLYQSPAPKGRDLTAADTDPRRGGTGGGTV